MESKLVKMPSVKGLPHAIETNPDHQFYGWVFYQHPDGQWVSVRKATCQEMKGGETMSFDEEPDGDIHSECAAEIHRLKAERDSAERTLRILGYTHVEGAELWKPPLGPSALTLSLAEHEVCDKTKHALAEDFREYLYRISSQVPFEHAEWARERGEALLAAIKSSGAEILRQRDAKVLRDAASWFYKYGVGENSPPDIAAAQQLERMADEL